MLSDEVIEKVSERIINRIERVNTDILKKIGGNLDEIGKLTSTEAQKLIQVMKYGGDYNKIVKELAKVSKLNTKDIKDIFEEVAKNDYRFAEQFYKYRGIGYIPYEENIALKSEVQAIANITARRIEQMMKPRVLGYGMIDKKGNKVFKGLQQAYYDLLDDAVISVSQGKETFDRAMTRQIKEMGGGGLKVIYDSTYIGKDGKEHNYTRRLDSAIRMNLKDSLRELHNETQEIFGEQFKSNGVEISVHLNPAPDHQKVQGKQFSTKQFEKLQETGIARTYDKKLIDIHRKLKSGDTTTDYRPISQYNCYHYTFNIILGVSEPEYTNEQLKDIKDKANEKIEIDGKKYTRYEITQLQRKLETEVRKQKDIQIMAKASGQDDLMLQSQQRITELTTKYKEISDKAKIPTRMERMKVSGYTLKGRKRTKVEYKTLNDDDFNTMENNTKNLINNLNEKEMKSLGNYTLEEYKDINTVLANKETKDTELIVYNNVNDVYKDITNIDSAIEKSTINDNIIVYKGTASEYFKNMEIGQEFELPIYFSTTGKESIARDKFMRNVNFKKDLHPALLEIKVPKGTSGIYMSDLFNENGLNEYEVLLERNLRYKLSDVKMIDTSIGYNEEGIYVHGIKYKKITLEVIK